MFENFDKSARTIGRYNLATTLVKVAGAVLALYLILPYIPKG